MACGRAFQKGPEAAWDTWLRRHERAVWEPLLTESYVLDIDNTIKPLSPEAIWAIILSVAFRVWLRGKGLHPVVEGNQTLLLLTT